MQSYYKLPFQFDAAALQADLAMIESQAWVPHFNTAYYQGDWSGVALRSVGGKPTQLYPDPAAEGAFADTALLAACPAIAHVLETIACEKEAVRLLRLRAGAHIREHRDFKLGFEDGVLRLHVPITTNPQVGFYLRNERLIMNEGECWYVDFNQPHRVENFGQTDRVHLVIDGIVNDWVRGVFAIAKPADG